MTLSSGARGSVLLFRISALCLLLPFTGCSTFGGPGSNSADTEKPGGELQSLLAPAVAPQSAHVARYVEEVGRRLESAAKVLRDSKSWPADVPKPADWMVGDVDFLLVDGTASNAFTAGGPHVYATAGLLRVCPTEDQFAAALAHAYAHVLCRHVTAPAAPPGDATKLALAYVSSRYTPAQERQADDLAVALFARAGWSVDEYAGLLQTLGGTPVTAARLTAVRPQIQTLSAPAADWQQPPVADHKRYAANQLAAASVIWPAGTAAQATTRARLIIAAYPNCLLGTDTPAQTRARADLQPPPPPAIEDNPWGKGLPGGR